VAIGGVIFGVMAGYNYWFPKAFGFKLNEPLGKAVFWCWFVGFFLAFMPLYALGLMGATRRMQHYSDVQWQPLMLVALSGAVLILLGIVLTGLQLAVSIRGRARNRDRTGDPWNGRTLEWSIPSPPPAWNFTHLPQVNRTDAYWATKQGTGPTAAAMPGHPIEGLHVPRNTPIGIFVAFFSAILGFSLIWRIEWLAIGALIGAVAVVLWHAWQKDREFVVTADEIAEFERLHARGPA
jgi:cytochrome o ubiquinol oxidase subunit I